MSITERIRKIAESQEMTLASIERDVNIGRGTIRKWDENSPSADKVIKVANLLQSSIDYILTGVENKVVISKDEQELLKIFNQVPYAERKECIAYLQGYIARIKYEKTETCRKKDA